MVYGQVGQALHEAQLHKLRRAGDKDERPWQMTGLVPCKVGLQHGTAQQSLGFRQAIILCRFSFQNSTNHDRSL